jgi:glycosyltransferase involved in cell wall biosynthesis
MQLLQSAPFREPSPIWTAGFSAGTDRWRMSIVSGHRANLSKGVVMNILAVLCIRNEESHLCHSLKNLIAEGIDVHLIDNDSTDSSLAIASQFLGRGLLAIDRLAWRGSFSLSDQLGMKRAIIAARQGYDWIIHVDADEWLCPSPEFLSLREAIAAADAGGFNCINFHEIAFIPLPGENFVGIDYTRLMNHYYFFQPTYPRLLRAWKKCDGLSWGNSGGHQLIGSDLRRFPKDLFLRHYIALSEGYVRQKYIGRQFSEEDLKLGWHFNRLNLTEEMLSLRRSPSVCKMTDTSLNVFDLSHPKTKHFWHW